MPNLSSEEMKSLIEMISVSSLKMSISIEDTVKASKECDEYFQFGNKNIIDMNPLSIYYVIKNYLMKNK